MTKDVMIRIKGLQYAEGQEADTTDLMLPGQYFERDDLNFVKYDEIMEEDGEKIRNLLKFNDRQFTVVRRGSMESTMTFEKGKNTGVFTGHPLEIWRSEPLPQDC